MVIITCVVPSQHLETRRLFSTSLTLVSLTEVATWRLEAHYGLALLSASSVSGTGPWNPGFCGGFWGQSFLEPLDLKVDQRWFLRFSGRHRILWSYCYKCSQGQRKLGFLEYVHFLQVTSLLGATFHSLSLACVFLLHEM